MPDVLWRWVVDTWGGFTRVVVQEVPEEEDDETQPLPIADLVPVARNTPSFLVVPRPSVPREKIQQLMGTLVERGLEVELVPGGREEFRRYFEENREILDVLLVAATEYLCPWV
jgi:hypothetical protein